MKFTLPIELNDVVMIRATGEQATVLGVKYENGSIGKTFYVDCFSIYTDKGMFALQELAKVTAQYRTDNYIDSNGV